MQEYDLVIQLGSHVKYSEGRYDLAMHTLMRTRASAIAFMRGIAHRLMISGGSNFFVRYDDQNILEKPQFTFEAFAASDFGRKSEAAVIKEFLVNEFNIPVTCILAEGLSATTPENAEFVKIMLNRRPMFTGNEKVAILTLLYHMERAFPDFKKVGLQVEPLFAENLLVLGGGSAAIDEVCEYYSSPKGKKQYDTKRMRELLEANQSLAEMMA